MNRRQKLAALAAVLVLAIGAVLWRDGRSRTPRGGVSGAVERPARAVAQGLVDAPAEAVPALAFEREALDAQPADAAAPSDEADEPEELVVEVAERATGAPVAGAEVSVRVIRASRGFRSSSRRTPAVHTDALGVARLPLASRDPVEVTAAAPQQRGKARFDPTLDGERRLRIELVEDWALVVEVVDERGTPMADADVWYERASHGGVSRRGASTDADGRAAFEHVGYEFSDPAVRIRVGLMLAMPDPPSAVIEREPPGGAPVRLVLPALGSVAVEVLGANGAPVADGVPVDLAFARSGETLELSLLGAQRSRTETRSDGTAVFERVGLGLELELVAGEAEAAEGARATLEGPRDAGERVFATLVLALEKSVLVFRAVDEHGAPLTDELQVEHETRNASSWRRSSSGITPDAAGRFEITLGRRVRGERRALSVTTRDGTLVATLDLSRDFPLARIDMGDLVLRAPPPLAEGRVVDASGAPVAGVQVRTSTAVQPGGPETRHFNLDFRLAGKSDGDGRFRIAGSAETDAVRLEVYGPRLRSQPVEVPVGTRDVELVALGTGGIAGRVLLDPGLPPLSLWVTAQIETTSEWVDSETPGREGVFRLNDLLPGRYTVAVRQLGEALAQVSGVEVRPGEVTADPRLAALDLRGRLHVFAFVVDPPPPDGQVVSVTFTPAGETEPVSTNTDQSARVAVVTAHPRIDAAVSVAGFRTVRVLDAAPRTEVRLEPGYPVVLALPPGIELPEGDARVGAYFGDLPFTMGSMPAFDARGELRCLAPETGRLRVALWLERRDRNSMTRSGIQLAEELHVDVRDVAGEQRFVLPLTNAALAAALEAR